ncbi:hypothetical protein B7P43_G12379 [Cryptotermes secundus]|uniref:Uncharacterized protein n=1 Tax=Cryptotermes secundus TaxID=105785 RepID=A0A2J7RBN9_9NEOP|nr:hypothetical protein B7P43_G12379 [Cryptotermes secundus]
MGKKNGVRVVNFSTSKNLTVKSTTFPHFNIHKFTWTSPDGKTHNQIDNIPKVHNRIHKSPPMVPILSQIEPVHNIRSYLTKIYFNIVHPPPIRAIFLTHLILLDLITLIILGEEHKL